MEALAAGVAAVGLEEQAEDGGGDLGPHEDYGLPKDHPYTAPPDRLKIGVVLPTADDYAAAGGQVFAGGVDCFRTHGADPDPVVATFSGVLSPEDCQEVIDLAAPRMSRAGVTTDDGKSGRQSTGRTNDSTWLPHDASPRLYEIVQRVSALVGLPAECCEDVQVIHYTKGQEYRKHWDACKFTANSIEMAVF